MPYDENTIWFDIYTDSEGMYGQNYTTKEDALNAMLLQLDETAEEGEHDFEIIEYKPWTMFIIGRTYYYYNVEREKSDYAQHSVWRRGGVI